MAKRYISKMLMEILDLLPEQWFIYSYQLVHHGWICELKKRENSLMKEPVSFFLHYEEGFVDIREGNKDNSIYFAKGLQNSVEIARVLESNTTYQDNRMRQR